MLDERSGWAKITIYEDDGTMAVSKIDPKSGLAFDNAKSANMDFDFFLTLNNMFASAGKNFLTDGVWKSTTPVLLKGVQFGNDYSNISVMKGDDTSEFSTPCTKFTLLEQGQGPGEMKACVAKITKKMPLPFTVSYKIGTDFDIELAKVANEKSSAVFYPQCLEKVKCESVANPLQADIDACQVKKGAMDSVNDDRNCVTKYECRTDRDRVLADLRQAPNCGTPSDAIINKALQCRSSNMGWNMQNDQNGCITGITCGNQPQG
jgi:hypothetical protein